MKKKMNNKIKNNKIGIKKKYKMNVNKIMIYKVKNKMFLWVK